MMNSEVETWVFFYGTFMNWDVLISHGVTPTVVIPAKLNGFELYIRPRVNLARSERSCVYGAIVAITHEELLRLYSNLEERYGVKYFPQPVLAETAEGGFRPVLCYIAPNMDAGQADQVYVTLLAQCVRKAGHPDWYAEFVESFGSEKRGQA